MQRKLLPSRRINSRFRAGFHVGIVGENTLANANVLYRSERCDGWYANR
jgi:hypothetical protein